MALAPFVREMLIFFFPFGILLEPEVMSGICHALAAVSWTRKRLSRENGREIKKTYKVVDDKRAGFICLLHEVMRNGGLSLLICYKF